ncbi:MAG TPA: ABC transporter ATP-binding protein [Candidatus Dormibacteraeota bacterium]|jgi:branched-chain amino acid transport system permease protein|nr:ABC transporter ATP-binding protein [Candidatus Dormibacteraeota bacterium]
MTEQAASPRRSLMGRLHLRERLRDRDQAIYGILLLGALIFPMVSLYASGGSTAYIAQAAHAGTWVLLAIGLNVVVGFAGLLDLGYAAFFAIGAYTYALFASAQLGSSPLHVNFHMPFWIMLVLGMFVAAGFGALLGFPTLRLRGDYLAIVTLGFGEIVPQVSYNLPQWTGGINAIGNIDQPWIPAWVTGPWAGANSVSVIQNSTCRNPFAQSQFIPCFSFAFDPIAFYVLIVVLIIGAVILVNNLYRSRLGRAWMAIREDEVAAAAMGINTVTTKLLAFAIGASFSGFAGAYYGASFDLVSPDDFLFVVSITVLVMVVLGGIGNITGVIVGALIIYFTLYSILPALPSTVESLTNSLGLSWLNTQNGDWPGLANETQRLSFLIYGLILVGIMLLRPQGLFPSRVRAQELKHAAVQEEGSAVEEGSRV